MNTYTYFFIHSFVCPWQNVNLIGHIDTPVYSYFDSRVCLLVTKSAKFMFALLRAALPSGALGNHLFSILRTIFLLLHVKQHDTIDTSYTYLYQKEKKTRIIFVYYIDPKEREKNLLDYMWELWDCTPSRYKDSRTLGRQLGAIWSFYKYSIL